MPDQLRHNIELKARLASLDDARHIATRIATSRLPDEHQIDTYFPCKAGRLKLREIVGVASQLIWYDRPDENDAKSSRYQIMPVHDPTALKHALTAALGVWVAVDKHREIFLFKSVRIHLDRVARLGEFLEFEAVLDADSDRARGHELVGRLRAEFDIDDVALVAGSYSDLLAP